MPTRGKCFSCGEVAFLTAEVLRNKETGSLHCVMICDRCKRYYEEEVKQDETEVRRLVEKE